jgi:hypothetical protein
MIDLFFVGTTSRIDDKTSLVITPRDNQNMASAKKTTSAFRKALGV